MCGPLSPTPPINLNMPIKPQGPLNLQSPSRLAVADNPSSRSSFVYSIWKSSPPSSNCRCHIPLGRSHLALGWPAEALSHHHHCHHEAISTQTPHSWTLEGLYPPELFTILGGQISNPQARRLVSWIRIKTSCWELQFRTRPIIFNLYYVFQTLNL